MPAGKRWISWISVVLFTVSLSGCTPERLPPEVLPVQADVSFTRSHMIIKNDEAFVWQDVQITLDEQYCLYVNMLPRGSSSFPLSAFADNAGKGYVPGLLNVRKAVIHISQTPEGKPGLYVW